MDAGEMKFFSGFSLGVFAPRRGKKSACVSDDGYSKPANSTNLQGCFLECLKDGQCKNVFVEHANVGYMESPPPLTCTLLGALKNIETSCAAGNGTIVTKLPGARPCAHLWDEVGVSTPAAAGAHHLPEGPPLAKCPRGKQNLRLALI